MLFLSARRPKFTPLALHCSPYSTVYTLCHYHDTSPRKKPPISRNASRPFLFCFFFLFFDFPSRVSAYRQHLDRYPAPLSNANANTNTNKSTRLIREYMLYVIGDGTGYFRHNYLGIRGGTSNISFSSTVSQVSARGGGPFCFSPGKVFSKLIFNLFLFLFLTKKTITACSYHVHSRSTFFRSLAGSELARDRYSTQYVL